MKSSRGAVAAPFSADPRENERVAHLVLGHKRPAPVLPKKPKGMPQREWKARRADLLKAGRTLSPGIEERVQLVEQFGGRAGTPETLARVAKSHEGALARMCRAGDITPNQLAAAAEIASVVESIQSEVGLPSSWALERVDSSGAGSDQVLLGSVRAVKWELAYKRWCLSVSGPLSMFLDIIVEDLAYSVAAARYRMSAKRAKRLLAEALDHWWACRQAVGREWCDIAAEHQAAAAGILA